MKTLFVIWMLLTFILCCSIIGIYLFIPAPNNSMNFETRSTWMQLGYNLLNKILEENNNEI